MAIKYQGPPESFALYEALVGTNPDVELKGATMPYTSRNGHMFSFLDKTGVMGLRLPSDEREEFLEKYDSEIAEQYGRKMKEYVVVPDDLLMETDELAQWFEVSHQWIGTLRPKPTKR